MATDTNAHHVDGYRHTITLSNFEIALTNGKGKLYARIAIGVTVLVGLVLALAVVSYTVGQSRSEWNPIGDFPEQTVDEVTDDTVFVTGTKCYDEDVTVTGSFGWQSIDPPGFAIPIGSGVNDRAEGCVTQQFPNPIPEAVLEVADRVNLWVLSGSETPVKDSNGKPRTGVTHTWVTEPFSLEATADAE